MNREAMKDYEKALEIADRIGDRMTSSIALTNIADILFEQHEFSRAEMLYSRALDICREIGDRGRRGRKPRLSGSRSWETGKEGSGSGSPQKINCTAGRD